MNEPVRVRFETCGEMVEWIARKRKLDLPVESKDTSFDRDVGFLCENFHAVIHITKVMTTAGVARSAIEEFFGEMPEEIKDRSAFATPRSRHWLATGELLPEKDG